ncbi:MAG: hypothetical protein ACOCWG_04775 [bacterium]
MNIEEKHMNHLTELVNIGAGYSINIMQKMLNANICLLKPGKYSPMAHGNNLHLGIEEQEKIVIVDMPFTGTITGNVLLIIKKSDDMKLAERLVTSFTIKKLEYCKKDVLKEMGNILINAMVGKISSVSKLYFSFKIPDYYEEYQQNILKNYLPGFASSILFNVKFEIKELGIPCRFLLNIKEKSLNALVDCLEDYEARTDNLEK